LQIRRLGCAGQGQRDRQCFHEGVNFQHGFFFRAPCFARQGLVNQKVLSYYLRKQLNSQ
jgi:hypothetical protein